jgi:hypothetical protein
MHTVSVRGSMRSKYKYSSNFVVKYAGNILKLQTKEAGLPYIIIGVAMMLLLAPILLSGATVQMASIAFVLVPGFGLLLYGVQTYYTTWTFDRLSGLLTHRKPGLQAKVYALDDIRDALLDSRMRRSVAYRVVLEMSDSKWVPLCAFGALDSQVEAHMAIRGFLGMEE